VTASTEASAWPERSLAEADIEAAVGLSTQVGWNQVADDWRLMLRLGQGTGICRPDGRLVATALTLPFGSRFGWISMVIVDRGHRGLGLAMRLLKGCVERLEAGGLVAGLDAAPAGRPVYLKLGFHDIWGMQRFEAAGSGGLVPEVAPAGLRLRPIEAADWPAILAYDRAIFGGRREVLLRELAARLPAAALLAEGGGRLRGFALGRPGRLATQVGPLQADAAAIALALAARAFAAITGPVFIDVPDRQGELQRWLKAGNFRVQRPFTRMLRGRTDPFDDTARLFAPAGPELA